MLILQAFVICSALPFLCVSNAQIIGNENYRPSTSSDLQHISLVENIDDIVDRMIPDVVKQMQTWKIDPLAVGNFYSSDLHDCEVRGVSTLYRSGNCYFTSPNRRDALLHVHLGFEKITGRCKFSKRIFLYRYHGTIRMLMYNATTFLHISQVLQPDAHPVLEYVDVKVPPSMELQAVGSDTVTFVVDALQIFYRRRMRQLVEHVLQAKVQEIVMEYFKRITLQDVTDAINGHGHLMLFNNTLHI